MFIDEARIFVKAGKGGNGCISFRREKYRPRGGPDGGDGGAGGNIILKVDRGLKTLMDFRYQRHFFAQKGAHGQGNNKCGRKGKDLILKVPPGTVVKDEEGNVLADLVEDGEEFILARGGRGGKGNARFTTSTRQTPDFAEEGQPGEEKWVTLEFKLLADVAIVGFPNSGKSTLINKISAAKAKVADYPFTTRVPNLGVVELETGESFVVADVPGLIKDAHKGKGLGIQFLKHIERANLLVYLLDLSVESPLDSYKALRRELTFYKKSLGETPYIVAGNKIDLPSAKLNLKEVASFFKRKGVDFYPISALTGEGVDKLVRGLGQSLVFSAEQH